MKLDKLAMPPYNTTMMGVLKGALDFHGLATPAPLVFGVSGHAFLINIHETMCPSGPYVWNRAAMTPLIGNLGLTMTDLGFYDATSAAAARATVDRQLREALSAGVPCSLINLEHQLITGYDETGFDTAQPWAPHVDFPPKRLTFDTWAELGKEYHVNFYTLKKVAPAELRQAVLASLDYGVELHTQPRKHSHPGYGVGPDAYERWANAKPEELASHGNWWNATVWSECRQMASGYFAELQQRFPAAAKPAAGLVTAYAALAKVLSQASDKQLPPEPKLKLIASAQQQDAQAIEQVAAVAKAIRAG